MRKRILDYRDRIHPRTRKIGRNIFSSSIYRVVSMAASFVMVPVLLEWLGAEKYGVWLTVQAVMGWFVLFDLGLGNGLRNKMAEALANGDHDQVRVYVSTAYAIISLISVALMLLYALVYYQIDWVWVFNAPPGVAGDLRRTMTLVYIFFCLQFVFQLVKMIWMADQRPALSALVNMVATVVSLVLIFLAVRYFEPHLEWVAWAVSGSNMALLLAANWLAFAGKYKKYRPSFRLVRREHVKSLTGIGVQFFILQGAALIVFATDNMIISQVIGPGEVPAYNIAYKYFNLVMVVFTLITVPYWSAFTDAFHQNDKEWIANTIKSLNRIWGFLVIGIIIMLLAAPLVYELWVGDQVDIPFNLSLSFALFVALSSGVAIYSNFLSGVGKIRFSIYHAVFVSVINIPLSFLLAGPLGLGSTGVILASVIGLIPRVIIQPIQYRKIMNGTAKGLWNR
jgi:O-antigen/teichoic acid export membrane protein